MRTSVPGGFESGPPVRRSTEFWELRLAVKDMAERVRQTETLKTAFSQYMSVELLRDVLSKGALRPGGERRRVTVLFSDVRDYTAMAERLSPEEVVATLNEYFTAMGALVMRQGGLLNYMGDAIMAVFGAPQGVPDDAFRAVRTAVDMGAGLDALNAQWAREGRSCLSVGIGINTGDVIAGNVGSPEHLEYTVMGNEVNVAFRLQALNKELGTRVLMTDATYREVASRVRATARPPVRLKGKAEPVGIYELHGLIF